MSDLDVDYFIRDRIASLSWRILGQTTESIMEMVYGSTTTIFTLTAVRDFEAVLRGLGLRRRSTTGGRRVWYAPGGPGSRRVQPQGKIKLRPRKPPPVRPWDQ